MSSLNKSFVLLHFHGSFLPTYLENNLEGKFFQNTPKRACEWKDSKNHLYFIYGEIIFMRFEIKIRFLFPN